MRKATVAAITGVLFLALTAVAFALTNNTVSYTSTLQQKAKAKSSGVNTAYEGILHIGTEDNTQPNTAPLTEVFFAKGIKNNAALFAKQKKSCKAEDVNGQGSIPAKCKKAVIGKGTAHATVGSPGQPNGIPQDLTVVALNGPKGKSILLAVIGGALQNYAVIPGALGSASAPFGYKVGFAVPAALQGNLSAQIALTDFDVQIETKNTAKKVKGKGKRKKVTKVTYLQMTKCPASKTLPTRAIVHFNNDDNTPGGQEVTNDGTMACK